MGDNNTNLKQMLKIYKPNGYDWMNFALTRRNPYTFHHIVSRSVGGKDNIKNGAILTRRAHDLLHILECICPNAYIKLSELFNRINASKNSPNDEIIAEVDSILYDVFHGEEEFVMNIDLSEYSDIYYKNKKIKVKKQRK